MLGVARYDICVGLVLLIGAATNAWRCKTQSLYWSLFAANSKYNGGICREESAGISISISLASSRCIENELTSQYSELVMDALVVHS